MGVGKPSEPIDVWLPPLFIRKKFFSLVVVGVCVPDAGSPLKCFFEKERDEKLRFSVAAAMMLQGANSMDPQNQESEKERQTVVSDD